MSSTSDELVADQLIEAAVTYLRDLGIQPAVVGPVQIQHQPGEHQHNHELVVRFTAVLPPDLDLSAGGATQ